MLHLLPASARKKLDERYIQDLLEIRVLYLVMLYCTILNHTFGIPRYKAMADLIEPSDLLDCTAP